jgi:hypothetical protein
VKEQELTHVYQMLELKDIKFSLENHKFKYRLIEMETQNKLLKIDIDRLNERMEKYD